MRKLRLTALILVLLGLLIGGVGVGMCFVEASSFTYGGDSRLNMTVTDTFSVQFPLQEDETLVGYESWNMPVAPNGDVPQIETDARVTPGTVWVDVDYRAVPGCTLELWSGFYGDQDWKLHISPRVETEAVLYAKDQLLSDIKNRQIGEYQWAEITGITFTVNPTDRDRLDLSQYTE